MPETKSPPLSVSTKTGDEGMTSLASGRRLPKSSPIFEVIGTIDELNSWLGLIAAKLQPEFAEHREFILSVQDTLFYVGAELADAKQVKLTAAQLKMLEEKSTALQNSMADGWHHRFLLPGGTELGGMLDVARTVCRRAERVIVAQSQLKKDNQVRPLVLQYMNRLSDYLYVLRCYINNSVEYHEREFVKKNAK